MACADRFDRDRRGPWCLCRCPTRASTWCWPARRFGAALQSVISRNRDPQDAAVLSITQFHAGDAYNVIP